MKRDALSILPQKMQAGSYFFSTMVSSFTKISTASRLLRDKFFLISMGRTILPNSSILLTIPVDFIQKYLHVDILVLSVKISISYHVIFVNICNLFFVNKLKFFPKYDESNRIIRIFIQKEKTRKEKWFPFFVSLSNIQMSRLPSKARKSVTSSAYSRSAPTGTP